MKIRGNTVGTTTPKPNINQTDPKKGDYIHGIEDLKAQIRGAEESVSSLRKEAGDAIGYVQGAVATVAGNVAKCISYEEQNLTEAQKTQAKKNLGITGSGGTTGTEGSTVYVGSGEMPEGYNVQIDPEGETPAVVYTVNGKEPDENGNVMVEVPSDEHINSLINSALGVIENGTY